MPISKRHHYVPQFFIKGFTDDEGLLWIYDKKHDTISRKSPKGIFFENDINSVKIEDEFDDVIEQVYSRIDDKFAKWIYDIRTKAIDEIETLESTCYLDVFIMFLFWRSFPNKIITDDIAFYLKYNNEHIKNITKNIFLNPDLSTSDAKKIEKSFFPFELFLDTERRFEKGDKRFSKIIDCNESVLFISDNPIIFSKTPILKDDISQPLFFPISKSRIYLGLDSKNYSFGRSKISILNITMINEAHRYIGASNKEYLSALVRVHEEIKGNEMAFKNIKDELFAETNINS